MKAAQPGYYQRQAVTHLDGTPIFQTAADRQAEEEVARILEARWHCEIRSFGVLALVDWYAQRDGRLVAVLDLKARSHESTTYPTVWLNVRKWMSLSWASIGLHVPALFVVSFLDGIRYQPLTQIDASGARIGGTLRVVKSVTDVEPVIDIPVAAMASLPPADPFEDLTF